MLSIYKTSLVVTAACLIIIIGMFYFDRTINTWSKDHSNLITLLDVLVNLIIGLALFWVAFKANNIAKATQESSKQKLEAHERQIVKDNYVKLLKAIETAIASGVVKNESMFQFWEVNQSSKIELPEELHGFVESVVKIAEQSWIAYTYAYDHEGNAINMDKTDRSEKLKTASDKVQDLWELLKECGIPDKFGKYLRVNSLERGA